MCSSGITWCRGDLVAWLAIGAGYHWCCVRSSWVNVFTVPSSRESICFSHYIHIKKVYVYVCMYIYIYVHALKTQTAFVFQENVTVFKIHNGNLCFRWRKNGSGMVLVSFWM
jgi:hypothetical protein